MKARVVDFVGGGSNMGTCKHAKIRVTTPILIDHNHEVEQRAHFGFVPAAPLCRSDQPKVVQETAARTAGFRVTISNRRRHEVQSSTRGWTYW